MDRDEVRTGRLWMRCHGRQITNSRERSSTTWPPRGDELLKSLAERAEFITLKKDELAVREGEEGDGFYVVVSGRLQACTQLKD